MEIAFFELPEPLHGGRLAGEQIQFRSGVLGDPDAPIVDAIVHPANAHPEPASHLGDRQATGHVARMRLAGRPEQPKPVADLTDRAGQDMGALRRAVTEVRLAQLDVA